jgi:ABC-type Mn2+/Zn2+ transport system permease subunit
MNSLLPHLREIYLPTIDVLWPALLTAAAVGIGASIAGTFVILRRQTLLAVSLPQIATLGAAIGLRSGLPTLPPAIGCVIVALLLIALAARSRSTHLLLPAIYVCGACLSILVVAGAGAELIQVQNLFTGIDVAVDAGEAMIATPVIMIAGMLIAILWRRWLLIAQSPAAAELARLRPARWDALFLSLLALILLIGTNALGATMSTSMLVLPPVTVLPWTRRIPQTLLAAIIASMVFLAGGLVTSIEMDWPLSQSVGGVGFGVFMISHLLSHARTRVVAG